MPLIFLHSGTSVTWGSWVFEPSVVGGALAVSALYLFGLRHARAALEWWRPLAFFAGAALIFLALASPLDAASDQLLSMHMLQHIVLSTIGPPLVLLGLPSAALRRLLPEGSLPFRAIARVTVPFVAAAVFIVNMWFWHIPFVYEAALTDLGVHITMHIAFLATGLLFWWPIVAPLPEMSTAGPGARLLYLFVTGFPMGILALLLLSAQTIVYGFYETQPSRLWGISALEDQQVAGVIMGGLGEATSFIAFSLIFVRYLLNDQEELAASAAQSAEHTAR